MWFTSLVSLKTTFQQFKQSRDNLEGVFGKYFMTGYIVKTTNYKEKTDVTRQQDIKDKSFNMFCSYVYLKNSDNN